MLLDREPAANPPESRAAAVAAWIAIVTAGLGAAFRCWRARGGTDFFTDDAYYYAEIARRLAATGRASFDGTTLTNGFHPLLLWLEAAAYRVLGTGAGPAPDYFAILAGICSVFILTCVAALLKARGSSRLAVMAIVVSVLALPRFASVYLDGMESVLVLPLLALVGFLAFRRQYGLTGVCAALLVLARLDSQLFLVAPLAFACALREGRTGGSPIRTLLRILGPPTVALAAFMVANQSLFGHPLPISGVLKSSFPAVHFQPANFFGNAEERLGLRWSVVAAITGLALLARPGRLASDLRGSGILAAVLALGQALVLTLFEKWSKGTPPWYLAAILPLGTFAFALGLSNALSRARLAATALVAALLALGLQLGWVAGRAGRLGPPLAATLPFTPGVPNASRDLLSLVRASPPEAVWASTDCGMWAFWSRRTFVNLDGLVNDFAYQDRLRAGELANYLGERRVRYLVLGVWDTSTPAVDPIYRHRAAPALFAGTYDVAAFDLYSHRWGVYSDRLALPKSAEVWRSQSFPDGRLQARLVVFDLARTAGR